MMPLPPALPHLGRRPLGRLVFGFFLFALLYRAHSQVLLHQLENPVLPFALVDASYWALLASGLPQALLAQPLLALAFDGLLLATVAALAWRPERHWAAKLCTALFAVYFLIYNAYGAHHTHSMAGLLLISVPFWARSAEGFALLWAGLRHLACWAYGTAFLWKIGRGTFFNPDQGLAIQMSNQAGVIYHAPTAWYSQVNAWLIAHPDWANAAFHAGVLMQGLMLVGLFTRRADRWLFWLPFLFHTGTWLFADVLFYELLVLQAAFLAEAPRTAPKA